MHFGWLVQRGHLWLTWYKTLVEVNISFATRERGQACELHNFSLNINRLRRKQE